MGLSFYMMPRGREEPDAVRVIACQLLSLYVPFAFPLLSLCFPFTFPLFSLYLPLSLAPPSEVSIIEPRGNYCKGGRLLKWGGLSDRASGRLLKGRVSITEPRGDYRASVRLLRRGGSNIYTYTIRKGLIRIYFVYASCQHH